jgi:hypothetical protein
LLHGVLGRTIEPHVIDNRPNQNAPAHEFPDRVTFVLVIPPKAVNPPDNKGVAIAQEVKQPSALGALGKIGADPRDAFVRNNVVYGETTSFCLAQLMGKGLVGSGDTSVKDRFHTRAPECPLS